MRCASRTDPTSSATAFVAYLGFWAWGVRICLGFGMTTYLPQTKSTTARQMRSFVKFVVWEFVASDQIISGDQGGLVSRMITEITGANIGLWGL